MKKFNINGLVECKLTDHGEKILRDYYSKFELDDEMFKHAIRKEPNGNNRFELWFFGHVFGNTMYNGAKNVIEDNLIYLQENDLEE